ncbi:MAG TPA: hypothetical protein VMB51_04385 [Solirubrobacteraceae bacterium]|nr:hypothetical protein [Solirubrobacteraceae bacterium]
MRARIGRPVPAGLCQPPARSRAATAATAATALLVLALPACSCAESSAGAALRESENPISTQGSRYDYRSNVTAVTPAQPGLQVRVVQYADRLLLTNRTGKMVTVYGYQHEPYARVLADGTVELNRRSRAYYLNQNFFGLIHVPPSASPTARPEWVVVDTGGELEWHDHRIHWMLPGIPPQVKDRSKRTKIFDWTVPISVGSEQAAIDGELVWVPEEDWAPLAEFGGVIAAALAVGAALLLRRRRRGGARPAPTGSVGPGDAW